MPLLVDVDTGWAPRRSTRAPTRSLIKAARRPCISRTRWAPSAAATVPTRRSSRRTRWSTASRAVDARTDPDFVVMARTDAAAVEGLDRAIERAVACVEAGADAIFPEAMTDLDDVPPVRRCRREGAGAGQPHRIRPDAAVHA
ncbi:isocitrate lyase/phosphoenolpyruvate mutase family protein [Ralstonia solanacearum]|uniref:isocitrate lyase/phosphoenolpyruvate mutase family protein n=1 Tax=Ralstonia solanacearum TaxID=305 RepID=UPI00399D7723